MSNADNLYDSFLSILTERVNRDGECDDVEVCKDLAAYINMLPPQSCYGIPLDNFIHDYGEEMDDCYMGRDAEGEKQYAVYNPETNWHERIRKELVKLGHYKRIQDWYDAQPKLEAFA